MSVKDLKGRKFGNLYVIERKGKDKHNNALWLCRCDCGNEKVVTGHNLRVGHTKSCGCLVAKKCSENGKKTVNNIIGERFGKLIVVERTQKPNNRPSEHHAYWLCQCDCGNTHVARSSDLKNGNILSCGCYSKERSTTHGMRHTSIYSEWCSIKQRCFNPKNKSHKNYGGRGITMCDRWKESFEAFYEDVSKLPNYGNKGYSLNRIDNNGNYEPNNVEWANNITQANNKRNNHLITYNGKTQTLPQWARELHINANTLNSRLNIYHWSVERALSTPTMKKQKHSV